ncbi:hypothetical protein E4T52_04590 [Aureobasidium sp. EXF-3400]|nr:hypothetical protein E4T51_03606 [Aureobasidium sp. EXF-12344]KAI4780518.1 hypothetical protein E4T52_04590 [Aureobasidium sp. EXF-3400]
MKRLENLTNTLAQERAGREYLQQELNRVTNDQNPFVLVLIDGNELIFRNTFLGQGDQGGRLAARALFQVVNEYVFSTIDDLPVNTKVIARVYVDLEDLCSLCLRAGLVNNGSQVKAFVRGFCQDKSLFDIIDVGMKGRAVVFDKMEDNLYMNIVDTHCKHIIFGCEDGEIYAPILKRLAENFDIKPRITLLHGAQPDSRLEALQLAETQMGIIFRDTKVDTPIAVDQVPEKGHVPALHRVSVSPPPSSSSPATTSCSGSRTATGTKPPPVSESHSRKVSDSSNQSASVSAVPTTSWAMAARKGAAVKAPVKQSVSEKEQLPADGIRRNKKGQRIDPPTPEFKKDEVNRLKKLKLCNAYHLRRDCPYPDGKCEHDHTYKCNAKELETLKLVARMSACIHGSECSDAKCIYGHRCPFPGSREAGPKGKACINGENCRFPEEMHNMDTTAVRRLKIT